MKGSVLIMGGTNNIGLKLIPKLLGHGCDVTMSTRGFRADPFGGRIRRVLVSRDDESSMARAFRGRYYDFIIDNTAYGSGHVKNLLNNIRCSYYLQASSAAVYFPPRVDQPESDFNPSEEKFEWRSDMPYWISKRDAECALAQAYVDICHSIIRLPLVIDSPVQCDGRNMNRIQYIAFWMRKGRSFLRGSTNLEMSFLNAEQISDLFIWILNHRLQGIYNISSIDSISWADLISMVSRSSGLPALLVDNDGRSGGAMPSPFNRKPHTLSTEKVRKAGAVLPMLEDWLEDWVQKQF